MVVIVTAALAMLIVIVVVMLVIVTAALTMLVVIVVVMLVIVTAALTMLIVIVVVMLVIVTAAIAMLVVIVVVMLVIVTAAIAMLIVIVVMMMVMMLLMLLFEHLKLLFKGIATLHCSKYLLAADRVPRSGYDNCIGILLAYEINSLLNLVRLCGIGVRKDDRGCILYLIVKELTEIFHIHLTLACINNGGVKIEPCGIGFNTLYRTDNVGKLADARGLDYNSVGIKLFKNLGKRLGKITDKRATDTARVHFGYLNTRILKKAAVNADLTELVFDKNKALATVGFLDKLFNKRGFTRAEKS